VLLGFRGRVSDPGCSIGVVIDSAADGFGVRLAAVASTREGWHPPVGDAGRGRLLRLDASALDADEALSALVRVQAERAALAAVEAELLVRAGGARRVVRDVLVEDTSGTGADGDRSGQPSRARRVVLVDEVVDEIAAALHRPFGLVAAQLADARLLHGPLARTRALLRSGAISGAHARAVCQQATRLEPAVPGPDPAVAAAVFVRECALLQDRVLPRAVGETASQTRQHARRVVAVIDAVGQRARRRAARCGVDVRAWGEDDGLAVVMARLPALDAARVMAAVQDHARTHADALAAMLTARTGDAAPTRGQLRAAALCDLLSGGTPHAGNPGRGAGGVEVQVVVDAATLAGVTASAPAWVTVGTEAPVPVDRDDLVAILRDPATPVRLRRLVTDPVTGALVDRGSRSYPVTADLAAWVAARDQTCRFPGCTHPALDADIDHAIDYADGGPTTIANAGALCRRHHNRKTLGGWTITDPHPDGTCTLTSPAGRRYHHEPVRLLPEPVEQQPPPDHVHPPPAEPPTDGPEYPF
jgi:hypothetical protein